MHDGPSGVAEAEEALEQLFRLTVSRKMYARQSAAVGAVVSRAGYAVLRCLDQAGPLAVGELAARCSMDPAAAGRQVRALEEEGFVARTAGADDGRRAAQPGRGPRVVEVAAELAAYVAAVVVAGSGGRTVAQGADRGPAGGRAGGHGVVDALTGHRVDQPGGVPR